MRNKPWPARQKQKPSPARQKQRTLKGFVKLKSQPQLGRQEKLPQKPYMSQGKKIGMILLVTKACIRNLVMLQPKKKARGNFQPTTLNMYAKLHKELEEKVGFKENGDHEHFVEWPYAGKIDPTTDPYSFYYGGLGGRPSAPLAPEDFAFPAFYPRRSLAVYSIQVAAHRLCNTQWVVELFQESLR
jgi:hypothetical protein